MSDRLKRLKDAALRAQAAQAALVTYLTEHPLDVVEQAELLITAMLTTRAVNDDEAAKLCVLAIGLIISDHPHRDEMASVLEDVTSA